MKRTKPQPADTACRRLPVGLEVRQTDPAPEEVVRQQTAELRPSDERLQTETDERVRTQAALWRITDELDGFFDLSVDLFCVADAEGRFKRLNPAWEKLLGYRLESLLGSVVLDHVHPDDVAEATAALRGLSRGEKVVNLIVRFRCRDRSYRSLAWNAAPYGDNLLFAVARDVTEQKKTDEELKNGERAFRVLAEISPVGIFRTDPSGGCVYATPRWCEIAGMSTRQARGQGWVAGLHPDDRRRVPEEWHRAARKEAPFSAEFRFKRSGGSVTWVFGHAVAEKDPAGEVVGYVGTIADITDRKRLEKETKELSETLELRVAERTQELARANAELVQTNARLEKEIARRRRANAELVLEIARSRQANAELVREIAISRRANAVLVREVAISRQANAELVRAKARLREQAARPRAAASSGKKAKP
jgi:PAS domain S-box-containing protein